MPASEVESFGRALHDAMALLRRVTAPGDASRPTLTEVNRALAEAEKRFVFAHPKLGDAQAQRFRSLFLQARKMKDATLSFEAPRFASQLADAWLLAEVDEGVRIPGDGKAEDGGSGEPSGRAEGVLSLQGGSPKPPELLPRSAAKSIASARALSVAKRRTPWHRRMGVRLTAAALLGFGVTAGVAMVMTEVAANRAEANRQRVAERMGMSPQPVEPSGRRVPAYVPPTSLGTDGPVVSVAPIDAYGASEPPVGGSPVAMLDWLNARFSKANDPEGVVADMVEALRAAKAGWRETGRLGALADCMTAAAALTTYPGSKHLLTSEIITSQGGDTEQLATAYAHVAMRLGLRVEGVAAGDGRPFAFVEQGYFGPAPRPTSSRPVVPVSTAVLDLALKVAERESAAGHVEYVQLDEALAGLGASEERRNTLMAGWRTAVTRRLPELPDAVVLELLAAHGELPFGVLSGAALGALATRLEKHPASLGLLRHWASIEPSAAFADRQLAAEVLVEHGSGKAMEEGVRGMLVGALRVNPGRFAAAAEVVAKVYGAAEALPVARALWGEGVRTMPVAAVLARSALAQDPPDELHALGVMSEAVRATLGGAQPVEWSEQEQALALTVTRHAGALALGLGQLEVAREVLEAGLVRWPQDRVLWRLMAEWAVSSKDRESGRAVLSRMLAAWPTDEPTRARLTELVAEEALGAPGGR